MRIFFFSTVFAPQIGGIERLAEVLCGEFVALGHEVRLGTLTPGEGEFPYPVIRRPSIARFLQLLRWCDVHVQANVSLKFAAARLLVPQKFVYQHNNVYQKDDGTVALSDILKAAVARATPGIANSRYTAGKTGCSQIVLNAYDDAVFSPVRPWESREHELIFLGRLVSQKGCDTLLRALGRLRGQGIAPALTVIGDGPDRPSLQALAVREGISRQVRFEGALKGPRLAEALNRHRFLVVPSRYEEPFGIVALEGLACGCVPVVSARGGLVEAIGGHGFSFANGSDAELADTLARALADRAAARERIRGAEAHLARCTARAVAERYLEVFAETTARRAPVGRAAA
jgi:glycosyltransferase involved in cell wall biosynthesis